MISDEVSGLANKRMMCLVCKSGQSNSSALIMLRSSVRGNCSYGVFCIRLYNLWLYRVLYMNSRAGTSTG